MKVPTSKCVILMLLLSFTASTQAQFFGSENQISSGQIGLRDICESDLDGDGDLDVLSATGYLIFDNNPVPIPTGGIIWHENDGTGTFIEEHSIASTSTLELFAADLDGDGDSDVLSRSSYYPYNGRIVWYENDGTGGFSDQQVISNQNEGPNSIYAADLNADGHLDVIATFFTPYTENKVSWFQNDGSGSFSEEQIISTDVIGPYSAVPSDFDGDGDLDILSASHNDHKVAWYENVGVGMFGPQQLISDEMTSTTLARANDFDGDGDMDVLSNSYFENKLVWFENDGLGEFNQEQVIATEFSSGSRFFTTDLDLDGDMDILTDYEQEIRWFKNDGSGEFGLPLIVVQSMESPFRPRAADLDGDGDVDILAGYPAEDKLVWYENLGLVDAIDEWADSPIGLFPNPMTTTAILDLGDLRGDFTLEIFDITGKLLRSETKNSEQGTLNLKRGELTSGQYLLRLSNEENSFELPFVVE